MQTTLLNADPLLDAEPPDAEPPPQNTWDATRYGQQAGGTHTTGMFSCSIHPVKNNDKMTNS